MGVEVEPLATSVEGGGDLVPDVFRDEASFRDGDTEGILEAAALLAPSEDEVDETTRVWNERFFWLVLAIMALLLPGFRRPHARRGE